MKTLKIKELLNNLKEKDGDLYERKKLRKVRFCKK
jgi:hypothetical protein